VQDVIHDQHDFEPNDSVVDVDQLLALCVQTWLDQEADDQVGYRQPPTKCRALTFFFVAPAATASPDVQ